MSIATLANKLLSTRSFEQALALVVQDSVASQFPALTRTDATKEFLHDWDYLLKCASVLAQSESANAEDASLRIATHCLSSTVDSVTKDAACVILDTLTNAPALRLAQERSLVEEAPQDRLPLPLRLAWMRRHLEGLVIVGEGQELSFNRFQREAWRAASSNHVLSITAPTSTGKSFLLCQWLAEYFRASPDAVVVYVVPTRALIQQVERDLREEFASPAVGLKSVSISSLPMESAVKKGAPNVLVFTQERLHILTLAMGSELKPTLLIIDEAHKVGDGARGVLLSNVVDHLAANDAGLRLFFASPLVSNPETLLEGRQSDGPTETLSSEHTTVNQNLLWVSQVKGKPKQWTVELCRGDEVHVLGEVVLEERPSSVWKRIAFVASALADARGGNLIYANGAAAAEDIAHLLATMAREEELDDELKSLIDLVKKHVHPRYALATTLASRVAFHYGNMPLLIRTEIERLFREGVISFLVCTSTLVEGVNLPCKSIFVRGPTKGKGQPMNENDFWNLAGRAGRLGKEFQGNIVCIDPKDSNAWKVSPPRSRSTYPIRPAAQEVLSSLDEFVNYVDAETPSDAARQHPEWDQLLSYLITQLGSRGDFASSPVCAGLQGNEVQRLEAAVTSLLDSVDIPADLAVRNPGISPIAMQRLLEYFRGRTKLVDDLLPVLPESEDAAMNYNNIFGRINSHLARVFSPPTRTFALSILVVDWMRGKPLAQLIGSRNAYYVSKERDETIGTTIRAVMQDVEQIARFIAPRYLTCYIDVLRQYLREIERQDLIDQIPEVNVWLEFGASLQTQLSLMGLGLSRTTAITISDLIVASDLNEEQVLGEIGKLDLQSLGLPLALSREVEQLLASR